MRSTIHRLLSIPFCAALAFGFSGCEDKTARDDANAASKELVALRGEVAKLTGQNDALSKQIAELRAAISTDGDKRMQAVEDRIAAATKDLQDKAVLANESIHKATESLKEMGATVVKSQEGLVSKDSLEARLKKLKEDLDVSKEDLRKYMDNQLRELYPYAYQPKRMDPNAPPGEAAPEKKPEQQN